MLLSQETAKRMGYGIGFFISWKEMPNLRSNLLKSCPKPNLARSSLYTNKLWKQFKWSRELVSFHFCFTWWAFSYSKDVSQVSQVLFLVSNKYYQSFSFESNDQVHDPNWIATQFTETHEIIYNFTRSLHVTSFAAVTVSSFFLDLFLARRNWLMTECNICQVSWRPFLLSLKNWRRYRILGFHL